MLFSESIASDEFFRRDGDEDWSVFLVPSERLLLVTTICYLESRVCVQVFSTIVRQADSQLSQSCSCGVFISLSDVFRFRAFIVLSKKRASGLASGHRRKGLCTLVNGENAGQ